MSCGKVRGSLPFSDSTTVRYSSVLAVGFQTSLSVKGYSYCDEKSLRLDEAVKRPVAGGRKRKA